MLTPYDRNNPFRMMRQMMDAVERDFWGFDDERFMLGRDTNFALDVSSDDNDVIVRAAIPGVKEEDIDIKVEGDTLHISAESRYEHEDKGERFHRREMRYGKFSRAVRLPEGVKVDKADAELEDGILTVRLPKAQPNPIKKIAVKAQKLLPGGKN